MKNNNILVMAGGTGGHVIPALSVARELTSKGYQVHWLGSIKGIENELVVDAGYRLHRISISGLRGGGSLKLLLAPLQILKALWQTFKVYRQVKPVMALGMGGFASGPGGLMAWLLRVPLVVHEQNAVAGFTNKLLSCFAKTVLQAFDHAFQAKDNLHTVGNPVRNSIVEIEEPTERLKNREGALNVLVVGGSLGAVALNNVIIEMMGLQQGTANLWHQTGSRNFDAVKNGYELAHIEDVKISAFINDMAGAFSWADVVICRSGALTVSELMAAGVASILVPYPFAVDDHQTANGQFLVKLDGAIICQQADLSATLLLEELSLLQQDRNRILHMSCAARSQASSDSAKVVTNYCIEAIND
jgi:UDP-N-acetylglucosamine--N-acetylmuramyl-(pentapeptide) pyrophosphoryl-undecaprenol N-acetylglucosamine transferase